MKIDRESQKTIPEVNITKEVNNLSQKDLDKIAKTIKQNEKVIRRYESVPNIDLHKVVDLLKDHPLKQ